MNIVKVPTENCFTCTTCKIQLRDVEQQRLHHKTEWHVYNMKRKIASLPPLSADEYIVKLNKLKNNNVPVIKEKNNYRCNDCKKTFANKSTFVDHLNSKKHKENVKNVEEKNTVPLENASRKIEEDVDEDDLEVEEVDSDEWDEDMEIDSNQCLFCSHQSANLFTNLEHMTAFHSFFIPDIEYCTDITGLLQYLAEKVSKYYMCLWCNEKGRTFYSVEAAKGHMVDKGHCRMIYEGVSLTEYVDFYDYSSTYPDAGKDVDKDEEVPVNVLDGSEFQLVLPSGVTVGHRSLLRYYKQSTSRSSAVVPSKNTKKLHKVLATYRALGWSQTEQEVAARKARDIHYLKRVQSKWYAKMGVKNNKFQKYFRQQVNY